MIELKDHIKKSLLKSIDELQVIVNRYMRFEVDGDMFADEQHFENAVRATLKASGFDVLEKHNVENIRKLVTEKYYSKVEDQIPDISVQCKEGLVFLELKFKNKPQNYIDDVDKVNNYLTKSKCVAAGVLFLDVTQYDDWTQCKKNCDYYYYWKLDKQHIA